MTDDTMVLEELQEVKAMLAALIGQQRLKEHYSIDEFARIVGRAPFTCREWARLGRIQAEKKRSGRGAHTAWAISHAELLRFQREGLLPAKGAPSCPSA